MVVRSCLKLVLLPFSFHPLPVVVIYDMQPNAQLSLLAYLKVRMDKEHNFWQWIEDGYGTPEEFAKILDLGIEMLFYLEEGVFSQREVQSVVEAIRGIIARLK